MEHVPKRGEGQNPVLFNLFIFFAKTKNDQDTLKHKIRDQVKFEEKKDGTCIKKKGGVQDPKCTIFFCQNQK